MELMLGPVDVVGNLWVIRPRAAPVLHGDGLVEPDTRSELRIVRPPSVDEAVAEALDRERCVSFFESGGAFAQRIPRVTQHLGELGITAEWIWTDDTAAGASFIDDDSRAVAWFLAHSADVLFLSPVALEKQPRMLPSWMPLLRWTTRALGPRARA
jgi:hypothetical protein